MAKRIADYKRTSYKSKTKIKEPETIVSEKKLSKNKVISLIFVPLFFIFSLLVVPQKIILLTFGINQTLFYLFIVIYSVLMFLAMFYRSDKTIRNLLKILFAINLIICIPGCFINLENNYSDDYILLLQKLSEVSKFMFLPTTLIGCLLFWYHKSDFKENINHRFNSDVENQVIDEMTEKQNNRRNFILNSIIVFVLILISSFTYFYKLDNIDMYSDEAQVSQTAYGYLQTGEYKQWDFVKDEITTSKNTRATPHLFLVSKAYKLFGVSEWSTRFFSVIFGIIFIVFAFLISKYFTKNTLSAVLIALTALFYSEYLLLFRWGRMYALFIPVYFISSFLIYKGITDKNNINFRFGRINDFIRKYLDFNFIALIFAIILIFIDFKIHVNSMLLVLISAIFLIYLNLSDFSKKYIVAVFSGIAIVLILMIFGIDINNFNIFSNSKITFFEVNNFSTYVQVFTRFPLSSTISIIFISILSFSLFFLKNKQYQHKNVFSFISIITGLIIFSFIFDYAIAFRYMSYLMLFSIILTIDFSLTFFEVIYSKSGKIIFSILILSILLFGFYRNFSNVYTENNVYPSHPSIAYEVINENAKADDALFTHWGEHFYFNDINPEVTVYSLGGYAPNPFDSVYNNIVEHKRGWITWHTYNSLHIDTILQTYASKYFVKYHGFGIDSTNVEVYFYDSTMIEDKQTFLNEFYVPHANLNLNNSFTLSFWILINNQININPFYFDTDTTKTLKIRPTINKKGLKFKYSTIDSIRTPDIADNQLHHIVFYQDVERQKYGVFVDTKFIAEKDIPEVGDTLVKFIYNLQSTDYINNVRIFLNVISEAEIKTLYNNGTPLKENAFKVDEQILESDFFWIKNF